MFSLFFTGYFSFPFLTILKKAEKKKRDKQAEVLGKVKFLEHIIDNYFESLKPKYVGWSNDALANEATEFLKRSAPLANLAAKKKKKLILLQCKKKAHAAKLAPPCIFSKQFYLLHFSRKFNLHQCFLASLVE